MAADVGDNRKMEMAYKAADTVKTLTSYLTLIMARGEEPGVSCHVDGNYRIRYRDKTSNRFISQERAFGELNKQAFEYRDWKE